jgi:multidrug resistance efflux pump
LDGVVGRVLVQPNQHVKAGDPLLEFDRMSLESRLVVARRARGTVQADYRQKSQRALVDGDSRAQLAVLQGQMDEKSTEVRYLSALNQRSTVPAPRDGVALFSDANEWLGRPVVTGEKIMVVADEHAVELEAWLAPADALPLAVGSSVKVFLNTDPLTPLSATLRYVAHEAVERPDGHPAYRVRATLAPGQQVRVGLKGTARLEGERVALVYWILRRPLAAARAWAGL